MKKAIIASAIALSFMGMVNTASAANANEVQFTGAVTATTCAMTPTVGGSVNNLVPLGTASLNGKATSVDFSLMVDAANAGCAALDATKTAEIAWTGNLNSQGLTNVSGSANGAWVELKTKNAKTTKVQTINSGKSAMDFAGDEIKTNGAQFTAQLNGGGAAGDFKSVSSFVVAYK